MCMRYVNATARCFDSVLTRDNDTIVSFSGPFDTIEGFIRDGKMCVPSFSILTEIAVMGTAKKENQGINPVESGKTLHFTLRLTKCDKDPEKQMGLDLEKFDIDFRSLKENNSLSIACYQFYNELRVTRVNGIVFPVFDTGKYVLKVLVNDTGNPDDDVIQSMTAFTVVQPKDNHVK